MPVNEVQDAVQRMAKFTAQLYYHLTKAMIEDFGEPAKKTISKGIRNFGLERGKNIAESAKKAGEKLTISNILKFYDMPIAAGWAPKSAAAEEEKDIYTGCTKSCVFADYWIEKGWRDIGKIYCEVDYAIREGYNEEISYTAEKNILKGDDCCTSFTKYKNKNEL